MSFPGLDGKHMAKLALTPSLMIPRSVLGSSWSKKTAGGSGSHLKQEFNENPTPG